MEIDAVDTAPAKVDADVLAFAVPDPVDLPAKAQEIDGLLEGELGHLIEDGELKGKLGKTTFTHTEGRLAAHRVAAAGVGSPEDLDADALRTAAAAVAIHAGEVGGKSIAWILDGESSTLSAAEQARAIVDGTVLGPYDAGRWKTGENERRRAIERLVFCGAGASALAEDAQRANVVVSWTNRCRDFVNAPPNECTPARLAEWAEETAGRFDSLSFEALGPDEIRSAGMGALAAVSQGSHNPPRLIKLSYEPSDAKGDLVLGLVGKAITFDAGGLSLKPADRMEEMKSDMGGGAAYRPGDIITALNGKTIEVTNTDAEGRLILADALWHARQSGATHIIDLATLTGAMVVAMGDYYAGLFGNDEDWLRTIRGAAEASGDHAWIWPLHETYRRYIDSSFADMKNSSDYRQGSPILAARFLEEFVGEGPWAHLDIAGTAYLERGRDDYYDRGGATGYGVRLLSELARRLSAT